MTIKEVEALTGLARSNIRFYEKEGLLNPPRNAQNGYRDYREEDVQLLKKIACLRTMEISIEEIRAIQTGEAPLREILEKQAAALQKRIADLQSAQTLCQQMLAARELCFDTLQVEAYVTDSRAYWQENKAVFKLDSVSFLHLWGSLITWITITALCLLAGAGSYAGLPARIPVQWDNSGTPISFVPRLFIFAYPAVCILIRLLLRPVLYTRLSRICAYRELITEYLSNYLCFVAFSIELFSILFVYGLAGNVVTVLLVDTLALMGLLIAGLLKVKSPAASNGASNLQRGI